jgi:hypothetical protein
MTAAAAIASLLKAEPGALQVDLWFRRQHALDVEWATAMLRQCLAALARMERWHSVYSTGARTSGVPHSAHCTSASSAAESTPTTACFWRLFSSLPGLLVAEHSPLHENAKSLGLPGTSIHTDSRDVLPAAKDK